MFVPEVVMDSRRAADMTDGGRRSITLRLAMTLRQWTAFHCANTAWQGLRCLLVQDLHALMELPGYSVPCFSLSLLRSC